MVVRSDSRSVSPAGPGRDGTVRRGPRRAGVLAGFLTAAAGAAGALAAAVWRAGADARSALVFDAADALEAVLPRGAAMRRKDSSGSGSLRPACLPAPRDRARSAAPRRPSAHATAAPRPGRLSRARGPSQPT